MNRILTALALATCTLILAPQVVFATCGAENKKPCGVFTGRKSCDSGLVEDFTKNKCVRPAAPKPIIKPKVRPAGCGRLNQRPCLVTEFVPSCDTGLVEQLGMNKCIKPQPIVKAKARPADCGRANQRPCTIPEFVPSCEAKLVENFVSHRCVVPGLPATCGHKGQRPCTLAQAFPSCEAKLVEDFSKNMCVVPQPLKLPSCEQAVKFVQAQGKSSATSAKNDTASFRAYLERHPKSKDALQEAMRRLQKTHREEIKALAQLTAQLKGERGGALKKKLTTEQLICTAADETVKEIKRLNEKLLNDKLRKGAFTLSAAAEADAIVGVAATLGVVFAYDVDGQQQLGAQLSVQGQAISDIDAAAGVQLGWWPGAKLTKSTKDWNLDLTETIGSPHDGLLSGPYVSVHLGAGPEFLAEVEIAIDFIFEVPDFNKEVSVDWFIDHFSGVTVTVTGGVSAIPAQFSLGAAIGNTFTVAFPPFK